jgi:hypothetical protein
MSSDYSLLFVSDSILKLPVSRSTGVRVNVSLAAAKGVMTHYLLIFEGDSTVLETSESLYCSSTLLKLALCFFASLFFSV